MKLERPFFSILILIALLGMSLLLSFQVGTFSARPGAGESGDSAVAAADQTGLTSEDATDAALESAGDSAPTQEPFPTPQATPQVNAIPLAVYPLIPADADHHSWGVVYRSGNELRLLEFSSQQDRLLVDSASLNGLYLAPSSLGVRAWGDIAPDGDRIALVLGTSPELPENNKGSAGEFFDLYLFERATGELNLLVEGAGAPKWSPDGEWIAYRGADSGLWLVAAATGETRRLYLPDAEQGHFVSDLEWSPDGQVLAFLDQVLRDAVEIRTVNLEGSSRILVPWEGYPISSPRWSADGSRLAFISFEGSPLREQAVQSIWMVDPDSGARQQMTEYINVFRLAWGWNGSRIFFDGSARFDRFGTGYEIWSLSVEDGAVTRLTDNTTVNADETLAGLSPDYRTLLFVRDAASAWALSLVDGGLVEIGSHEGMAPIRIP